MTTALLIIDMQQAILAGLADPARPPAIDAQLNEVADRLGELKRKAEAAGMPVVLVQHDGDPGHRLEVATAGWQFRSEVAPGPETVIVHKRNCDAFHDTDLGERLATLGIDQLVIGGCMTQFCVDTTTRRAVSMGFNVLLPGRWPYHRRSRPTYCRADNRPPQSAIVGLRCGVESSSGYAFVGRPLVIAGVANFPIWMVNWQRPVVLKTRF